MAAEINNKNKDKNSNVPKQERPVKGNQTKPKKPENKSSENGKVKKPPRFLIHIGIIAMVNVAVIVGLFLLLGNLTQKAKDLQRLRSLKVKSSIESDIKIVESDVKRSRQKLDELTVLFPDEQGLIVFVKEIDDLKEQGIVTHFSFASNEAVRDKTGYSGLPILIELKGSEDQIDYALRKIQELPFLIRAINVSVVKEPEEGVISFRYGGFIYVKDTFSKN